MAEDLINIEDLPTSAFHRKIAAVTAGGPFCDGYLLGIIVVALPFITRDMHLGAMQVGLVGAASLAGMCLGGLIFGPMTDRFGRKRMYIINLVVFLICSLANLLIKDVTTLLGLRFLLGVALGADYPIATALATEFMPKKLRGPVLGSLMILFLTGYTASLAVGLLVGQSSTGVWRLILASAAVPSGLFLLLRMSVPESPRWLIATGRAEDARRIVRDCLGPRADFDALVAQTRLSQNRRGLGLSNIRELFSRGYGRMLAFCATFWTCQIIPSFAVKTFQPMLLGMFGVKRVLLGAFIITSFNIVGALIGMLLVNRIGRRPLLIGTGIFGTIALLLLATPFATVGTVAIALFISFTVAEAAGATLQFIYPNEIFPTDVRATGMGLALSVSRVGAATGTFLLPTVLSSLGLSTGLLIAGGVSFVGLLVAFRLAPETRGVSLGETPAVSETTVSAIGRTGKSNAAVSF